MFVFYKLSYNTRALFKLTSNECRSERLMCEMEFNLIGGGVLYFILVKTNKVRDVFCMVSITIASLPDS